MPKKLVIVESPAKTKTIQKFLGSDFELQASYGHVRDLPKRTLGVDIKDQFKPTYQPLSDKKKVISTLNAAAKKADEIYIATDPDREGEAIAWHIQESLSVPKNKIKRIVFNEITKKAVLNALSSSRDINPDLVDAQQARRILDRIIGYKLSPVLSKKIRRGLSAGRVQSAAVKIICDREKEILAFVPEEYWDIEADFKTQDQATIHAKLFAQHSEKDKLSVLNQQQAESIVKDLQSANYQVDALNTKEIKRMPAPPFITSTLQQDASRKLNWTSKKTMSVAQKLYEGVDVGNGNILGLITYMRTDSIRISDDAKSAAYAYVKSTYGDAYVGVGYQAKKGKNASVQDAHEAIRPSDVTLVPQRLQSVLQSDHYKLYKLIWDRFLASQMAPARLEQTQIIIASNPNRYLFKATGQVILFDGFMKIYRESKESDESSDASEDGRILPAVKTQDPLNMSDLTHEQKFTQPPSRYTEASLVKEMEEKGIGRPSTYAPTISTILDRLYVEKDRKRLLPTELGMLVNDKLEQFFTKVMSLDFTAKMETELDEITEGKHKWQDIVAEFYDPFDERVQKAYTEMESVKQDKPTDEVCEKCGSGMVIKEGRFGAFMACSNFPACKNTKSLAKVVDIPCPLCGGKILERRSRKGKVFYGCDQFPKCTFASWEEPNADNIDALKEKALAPRLAYQKKSKSTKTSKTTKATKRSKSTAKKKS